MSFDLDSMEVQSRDEAEQSVSGGGAGRESKYEPIAEKWSEIPDGKAIVLSDLANNDVQNIRNLLYRRFGKENVIVRATKTDTNPEGTDLYKAVVREREGGEYLRDDSTNSTQEVAEDIAEDSEEPTDDELEDVF